MKPYPYNILVVEDDHDVSFMITLLIEDMGYKVHKAYNGAEALALLKENNIDLIVLDLMMPVMDGFKVLDTVRADSAMDPTKIIVMSALSDHATKEKVMSQGADAYIEKGRYSVEEIQGQIRAMLEF